MKFIKPSEISSKIMTLIEESDEYLILVSPYVRISKWYKLLKKLESFKKRNIPYEFIVRDDENNKASYFELENIGIQYTTIENLHCKLYLNEKYAIVSSMNLLLSSEINSIEIAYQTETDAELNELKEFCTRYIDIDFNGLIAIDDHIEGDWRNYVCEQITASNNRFTKFTEEDDLFTFTTNSNKYTIFVYYAKGNKLRMNAILTNKEYRFLAKNYSQMPGVDDVVLNIQKGNNNYYDSIWGTADVSNFTNDIRTINDVDKSFIANKMIEFVLEIDSFKNWFKSQNSNYY